MSEASLTCMTGTLLTEPLLAEPLDASARRVDAALEWCGVRTGVPEHDPAWTRCADVDGARDAMAS